MSFIIDTDTTNVPELTSVAAGEYEIRFVRAEQKNSKAGDPMIEIIFDIPSEPLSKDIFHYIMMPLASDSEKQKVQKLGNLKALKAAFNLPQAGPVNGDDLVGLKTWAILNETDSEQYGKSNSIKKFVVSK